MVPYLVHGVHSERVRPETVVHRHKGQAGAARGQKHSHQGGRHAEESLKSQMTRGTCSSGAP